MKAIYSNNYIKMNAEKQRRREKSMRNSIIPYVPLPQCVEHIAHFFKPSILPTSDFRLLTIFLLICLTTFTAFAQAPIKKEVEVVKPYEPTVSDANKISVLPQVKDTVTIRPAFNYNIVPMMVSTEYSVPSINAAKMLAMPIPKLYKSYLKLGYGNYASPLAEVYINSLRSKKYSAGAFLKHNSSKGDVTLANNRSVYGGYAESQAGVFGKRFLKKSYLFADAGVRGNTNYRYGYNPAIDTVLEKGEIRQSYLLASVNTGIHSLNTDSSKLTYHVGFGYDYFKERENRAENNLRVEGKFNRMYEGKMFGVNTSFDISNRNKMLDSTGNVNSLFILNPWVGLSSPEYRLQAGLNINFDKQNGKLKPHIYPKAEFQFNAVKDVLIAFVGVSGTIKKHSYRDIAYENPYVNPNLLVDNSNAKLSFYGGIKGSLGNKASYILKVDFSDIDNQYFFVNDTTTKLRNQFTVVYNNATVFNGYAEINYDFSESLTIGAKGNIYRYTLDTEQYAWHMPTYDLTISSKYSLRNKILLNLDILALGKRYAKEYSLTETSKTLSAVLDFNLGVEYRYTKILSAWIRLNNITASKYYTWNQYPAQRFNLVVGISYSL